MVIESQRRKHLAYLMADQGAIVNPDSAKNLPKQVWFCSISLWNWFSLFLTCMIWHLINLFQQLNKRHLKRSRSLVSTLLWGEMEEDDFGKAKNIRQTEILVDLREAILKIARHFQSLDPKNNKVVINYCWKVLFLKFFMHL